MISFIHLFYNKYNNFIFKTSNKISNLLFYNTAFLAIN